MKKILIGAAAGAIAFGGAFAFAAGLDVNSNNLGAGEGAVGEPCDPATVAYTTEFNTTLDRFAVDTVTVSCGADGDAVGVALLSSTGVSLWSGEGVSGTAITVTDDVAASDVLEVHVVATNTPAGE